MARYHIGVCIITVLFHSTAAADTVALWLFDDPLGSPAALDSSGNGYHLTLGPDAKIVSDGRFGGALDADATAEDGLGAFRHKAESALNPGDEDWTLECWLKAKPGMAADNRIWGLSGVNYIDYGRGKDAQGLFVASRYLPIDSVNGWNKPTGNLQADHEFHHIAVVYDSNAQALRHYFDGQLQFTANGRWKDVPTGEAPYADVVLPPHYPMLQIGCRDAYQQWDHREIHLHERHLKKFQGYIDEMRFSDGAIYNTDFTPPRSFARPTVHVWPQELSIVAEEGAEDSLKQAFFAVSAVGGASADVNVSFSEPWLRVKRRGPTAVPSGYSHAALVDTRQLTPGKHEATLSLRTQSGSKIVKVSATILTAETLRDVGSRKQLFIDDRFIESSRNVELHINPATKLGPLFRGAHYPRNIVYLEDKGVWRMYFALMGGGLQYAQSKDGINWKRFGPGKINYESEREPGKLIPLSFGAVVMLDPQDIPERRFKAFVEVSYHSLDGDGYEIKRNPGDEKKRSQAGVYAFVSADGLTFKKTGRVLPVLPEFVSFAPHWDPNISKYVSFFRCQNTKAPGISSIQGCQFFYHYGFSYAKPDGLVSAVAPDTMGSPGFENLRSIARIEVDDLLKPWPVAPTAEADTMYATSNQVPMVFTADYWDGFADFYVHSTLVYPYAQDVYLMFPTYFRHFHPSRQPYFHAFDDANGPLETVLAVSRDGKQWDRIDRKAYVPLGRNDEWDCGRTMMGLGMVRHGNDLYQYYWGGHTLHDSLKLRPELEKHSYGGIGIVKQRLDGFVSADVGYQGGSLTTPPLKFPGNRLQLNHNCGGQGTLFVELRDANDVPIPGFTLADCEEVAGDDVGWEIRWRGSGDIGALAGKPIKVHFKMRNAKLYAFQFVDADDE